MNMMTLAEHIIEATPDRIKSENFVATESTPLDNLAVNNTMSWLATYLGDAERYDSTQEVILENQTVILLVIHLSFTSFCF